VKALFASLEAAKLLEERIAADGLYEQCVDAGFFKHQGEFLGSTKAEAWLFGANRSGKTEGLAACLSSFLRFGSPDPRPSYCGNGIVMYDRAVKVWGVSLTFDMSRNILQPKMFNNGQGISGRKDFIPASEILDWNITNQTLKLKNGSICMFKSCDGGRDIFQGADVDMIGYDEVPKEEVYKEGAMRVGGGRRLLIRGAATILPPPNVPGGVSWMFNAKVKPWLESGRNAGNPNLDIFTASIYDNTTILPEELERMEAQYPPGSQEYLIRMKGELLPSIGGALVYPTFMRSFHEDPSLASFDEELGIWRPSVNPFLPLVLSVDFNPMDGTWLVGQKRGNDFCVIDEVHLERSDIPSMCHEFRNKYPAHAAELHIYGDSTGRRRHEQTGESNFHLIQQYLSGYPVPIRYYLPEVNPPVTDRIAAVNLHLRSPDGMRKVRIAPHCEELFADLETAKWKANGKIDKRGNRRQDAADCLGYWINYVNPTTRFAYMPGGLKSVRSPQYSTKSAGVFPASKKTRPVRIGNRWYVRRVGAS
jgi:phage terminase large subunit-like protein